MWLVETRRIKGMDLDMLKSLVATLALSLATKFSKKNQVVTK